MFEWDETKSLACRALRGFDFSVVNDFNFQTARILIDDRQSYGEIRYRAFNEIEGQIFNVVFTVRGENLRIISVRKVHAKEGKKYGF